MGKIVIPRMRGDDYQARFFWLQACRLFQPHSNVIRVGYELDDIDFFDDVATFYGEALADERGDPVQADYYQIKYHVDQRGGLTWRALMDPDFIKGKSSILQWLSSAGAKLAPNGKGCRLHLVTTSAVHPEDELATLVGNEGGAIRLHVVSQGKTERSAMGKVRSAWREHLQLAHDEELLRVLRPLRIHPLAGDLWCAQQLLNERLACVGLAPVDARSKASPYDDLIRKIRAEHRSVFTREEIREICERDGLWRRTPMAPAQAVHLGIRSFMRWAEYMEDETDRMLCLVRHFDNRAIRDPRLWREEVYPELAAFLSEARRESCHYQLHLDVHASIAFAAGYCLPAKSGISVAPVQRTPWGEVAWKPGYPQRQEDTPEWSHAEVECGSDGNDVAIVLSATHDALADARIYVDRALPNVNRIISLAARPKPSTTAIRDGPHALSLAQEVASVVRERSSEQRTGTLHIFAAAPNALVFFVGQLAHGFGRCVLYEYDLEKNAPGAYEPSLEFAPECPE